MANEYTWSITELQCVPSLNGLTDVVKYIMYRLYATDGQYGAVHQDKLELSSPNPSDFIPYDNLTQEQIIAWVQTTLGQSAVNNMIANLDQLIEADANPPTVNKSLPW